MPGIANVLGVSNRIVFRYLVEGETSSFSVCCQTML